MMGLFQKFRNDETGTTAVEFALIAFSFLTIIFGIFEGGRMFMTWNAFQYSLEDTTRRALVSEDITPSELEDTIAENMQGLMLDPANITVNVEFTDYSGVNILEIDGTYAFSPILLGILPQSWSTINLRAQSRLPMSWE